MKFNFKKINQYTLYEIFRYLYEKIYKKIYSITTPKIYSDSQNISESDDGNYISFVKKCTSNKKIFDNFKRNPIYRYVLEHSTYKHGLEYIKHLDLRTKNEIDKFLINDKIGNPIKFHYKLFNKSISPGTLRYLKVMKDIEKYFGNKFDNIVEIGCGYGGQYIILDQSFNIINYTLFDLPEVNTLIKKNLENYSLKSKYEFNNFDVSLNKIDLVISNYSFSELQPNIQINYLKNIISKSLHGYMTMNSGLDVSNILDKQKNKNLGCGFANHLSLTEIRKYIPNCKVVEEIPLTGDRNYIIIW